MVLRQGASFAIPRRMPTRLIYDVSIPLKSGGLTYPGNPEFQVTLQQSVSGGASGGGANVSRLQMGSHTGTHVDAPRHFYNDGASVDKLSLEVLTGPARVVEFGSSVRAIERSHLERIDLTDVKRILFKTRNSDLLKNRGFQKDYTYVAPDGAEYLAGQGIWLVGVDYLSVEQFRSGHHRTHHTLLSRGIIIIEGLDLSQVPGGDYDLYCLPLRIEDCDGAPARTILIGR